jgi:hypothetical protein
MKITREIVVFDAADLPAESAFWAGLLGGTVDAEDDWHTVSVDGNPRLGFQLAPNHMPPEWPDGAAPWRGGPLPRCTPALTTSLIPGTRTLPDPFCLCWGCLKLAWL